MWQTSAAQIGFALALGAAPWARLQAQATDSSTGTVDSSARTVDSSTDTVNSSTRAVETYLTNDGYGLGRVVPGSLQAVTAKARSTMIRMKIVEGRTQPPRQGWQELLGRKGSMDVSIRLRSQGANTRVEVNARVGPTGWDMAFAQQVLDGISAP